MKLKVVLEPSEEGGYTVYVPSLPGCISEGENKKEALANIKEAIELYLEPVEDDLMHKPGIEITEVAVIGVKSLILTIAFQIFKPKYYLSRLKI